MIKDYTELLLIPCSIPIPSPLNDEVGGFILTDCVFESFIDDYAGSHTMFRIISKGLK